MDLSFLANNCFGWTFVFAEIIIFYAVFLVIHRVVERKHGKQKTE